MGARSSSSGRSTITGEATESKGRLESNNVYKYDKIFFGMQSYTYRAEIGKQPKHRNEI